jgi:drug/metabolite transporter (DMT)-like permease
MKVVGLFAALVACTVAGNLLLKHGARQPGLANAWPLSVVNLWVLAGAAVFACGLLAYAAALRVLPLNVAQAFAAAQFIAVIVASTVLLGEPIGLVRWIGIALIAIGIVVVGSTVGAGGKAG